jgi:hypothetical protein
LDLCLSIDESQDSSFVFSRVVYFKVDYLMVIGNCIYYGEKIAGGQIYGIVRAFLATNGISEEWVQEPSFGGDEPVMKNSLK